MAPERIIYIQDVAPTYKAVRQLAYWFRLVQAYEVMHGLVRLHVAKRVGNPSYCFVCWCNTGNHRAIITVFIAQVNRSDVVARDLRFSVLIDLCVRDLLRYFVRAIFVLRIF